MDVKPESKSLEEPLLCESGIENEVKKVPTPAKKRHRTFAPSKTYFDHLLVRNAEDETALYHARYFMVYAWLHLILQLPFLVLYSMDLSTALPYKIVNLLSQTFLVAMQVSFIFIFLRMPRSPTRPYWAATILTLVGNVLFLLYAIIRLVTHEAPVWEPEDIESDNPPSPSREDGWVPAMQALCLIGGILFVVAMMVFVVITFPTLDKTYKYRTIVINIVARIPRPWKRDNGVIVGNILFLASCIIWLMETIRWIYPLAPHEHDLSPAGRAEHVMQVRASLTLTRRAAVLATLLGFFGRLFLMWGSVTSECDMFLRRSKRSGSLWTKVRPLGKKGTIPMALATPFFASMFGQ